MGTIKRRPLKLWMRRDGHGKIISGSAVWRLKAPRNGNWVEITQAYECCNTTTTTTTAAAWPDAQNCYYITLSGSVVAVTVWDLIYCGDSRPTRYTQQEAHETFCLAELPVLVSGMGTYVIGDSCVTTTTTTTVAPTTTTTTTAAPTTTTTTTSGE